MWLSIVSFVVIELLSGIYGLNPSTIPTAFPTPSSSIFETSLPVTQDWSALASDSTGQYLYAAQQFSVNFIANGTVYYSHNGGVDWSITTLPTKGYTGIAASSSGSIVAAAGINGYLSIDYGSSWRQLYQVGNSDDVSVSSNGLTIAFTGTSCLTISTDGGSSWTTGVGPGSYTGFNDCQLVALANDGKTILVYVQYQGIFTSIDSGSSWTLSYNNSNVNSVGSIVCNNVNTCYAGITENGAASVLQSTDSGQTWTTTCGQLLNQFHDVSIGAPLLAMSSDGAIVIASNGELHYSSDACQSFQILIESDWFNDCITTNSDGSWSAWSNGPSPSLESIYVGNIANIGSTMPPTKAPAMSPGQTFAPTCPPTYTFTTPPTMVPTIPVTTNSNAPTLSPTHSPTVATNIPSISTTVNPTIQSTKPPTPAPTTTSNPTTATTASPTMFPTPSTVLQTTLPASQEWSSLATDISGQYLFAAQYFSVNFKANGTVFYSHNGGIDWTMTT